MERKEKNTKIFNEGDFVFAKMRGYRAWPARVLKFDGRQYWVFFYGTCDTAKVSLRKLYDYYKCEKRYTSAKRPPSHLFKCAMLHILDVMDHPDDDPSYELLKAKGFEKENTVADIENDSPNVNGTDEKKTPVCSVFKHITADSEWENFESTPGVASTSKGMLRPYSI